MKALRLILLLTLVFSIACLRHPIGADPASSSAVSIPKLAWHKVVLEHITPGEIIEHMHWTAQEEPSGDSSKNPESPSASAPPVTLPEGVKRIYALEGDNSLLIEATPEGYQRVREIAANLDALVRRQFQFKIEFIRARREDVKALGLSPIDTRFRRAITFSTEAAALLQKLLTDGSTVLETRTMTTDSGSLLVITYQASLSHPDKSPQLFNETLGEVVGNQWQNFLVPSFSITLRLRLHGDGTISLVFEDAGEGYEVHEGQAKAPFRHGQLLPTMQLMRTMQGRETIMLEGLMTGKENELLVFITPTLLPQQPVASSGDKP